MPMDYATESERLRRRMNRVRRDLDYEVEELVDQANHLTDWRFYMKNYPFASLGAVAMLAYTLVPIKKRSDVVIDEHTLSDLLERGETQFRRTRTAKPSLFSSAMQMASQAALRAGITFVTHKLLADQSIQEAVKEGQESQNSSPAEPRGFQQ